MKREKPKSDEIPESKESVRMKFTRASLEDLAGLMPMYRSGRFMELKAEARREVADTPPGQFAIIKGTSSMIKNKREQVAALVALKVAVSNMGWVVRWSPQGKCFLLVRREDWNKKNGGKSK